MFHQWVIEEFSYCQHLFIKIDLKSQISKDVKLISIGSM